MFSKAIAICALVVLGIHLISADELSECLEKLNKEKAELKAEFKDRIRENFLKPQNEADKFIVENYGSDSDVTSANTFKRMSIISAQLEAQKYAAVHSALDITGKILKEEYGKKFEICGGNLIFNADLFDVLCERAKTFALSEVYSYFGWDQMDRIQKYNGGNAFSAKVDDLVQNMIALRNKATVDAYAQMKKVQGEFCQKYHVTMPLSLATELDILIRKATFADIRALRNEQTDKPRIICQADLAELVEEYVSPQLVQEIEDTEEEVLDLGRKDISAKISADIPHLDSHNVEAGDEFFIAKNE